MFRSGSAVAIVVGVLLLAAPGSAAADYCEGEDTPISAATAEAAEVVQLCLINVHRSTAGLPALTNEPALRSAARGHSRWMDDNNTLCNYPRPPEPPDDPGQPCDGSPDSRATAAGYPFATGENIAWSDAAGVSSRQMFELWRSNPGQNANMFFADYVTAGVGFVTGTHGVIGTQQFGTADNGATDTAVSLLRRDGCPAAQAKVASAEAKVAKAKRKKRQADTRDERRRAKRKLRRAKTALGQAQAGERAQCQLTTYAGSFLGPAG